MKEKPTGKINCPYWLVKIRGVHKITNVSSNVSMIITKRSIKIRCFVNQSSFLKVCLAHCSKKQLCLWCCLIALSEERRKGKNEE